MLRRNTVKYLRVIMSGLATDALKTLGLSDLAHQLPETLSGGQAQRVAVARVLASGPGLILADEPTASLDGVRGAEVMTMLRMVADDMGKAVVMVSHDHRVLPYADRVVWLEDGNLEDREPASMASTSASPSAATPA